MGLAEGAEEEGAEWWAAAAGEGLREELARLREGWREAEEAPRWEGKVRAVLRPYQREGVRWLETLDSLGLGACLADDMGLGKTLQTIAFLVSVHLGGEGTGEELSLLVVPASLLGNWRAELERFAPGLGFFIAHRSAAEAGELEDFPGRRRLS